MSIIIAIIIFSLIVIIHETGHFLLAKKSGIRVEEFCIGFGPTLVGFTRGETKYSIKLLPFGGACMMTGEDGDSEDPRAFNNAPLFSRIAVVFAGPAFNFILAFLLAVILISCVGYDEPVISGVTDGYSAQEAGMEAGDRIISINGNHMLVYRQVSNYIYLHPSAVNSDVTVVYQRDGQKYTVSLTPEYSEDSGRYLLGIQFDGSRTRGNILNILKYSLYEVVYWISTTLNSLKLLVLQKVAMTEVSGPVGIVSAIGTTYTESKAISWFAVVVNMINISILLTANLGVMNLLPLPALDGGRLVFLLVELVTRRRVPPDKEGMVHGLGFMLLLALMVFVMFNDIHNLIIG